MYEVSQANTGSRAKISAVLVGGRNCCAQAWTVKATAVPRIPVTRIAHITEEDHTTCGLSINGASINIRTAEVATCKKAICSKGCRWLARPSKMIWKIG